MPTLKVADLDIYYEDLGHGSPLLLLGGTLGTASGDFAKQIDAFACGNRVIAPERRGYGRTRPPDRDYPDDFYRRDAKDMAAFMTALELPPAIILGWSEGADVALCLGAEHPDKVARLVVWGGLAEVTEDDIALFESRRDVSAWPPKVCTALTQIYGESYWQTTWWKWCDVMQRLHATGGDVGLPELERIRCPTLIVQGPEDPLVRSIHGQIFHRRIGGSNVKTIAGSGHNPHITHAAEFNRLVFEFMGNATPS